MPHSIGTSDRPCTLVGSPQQVMMARSKLNEIIMRGGPRENQGYGNGDNNQMSYNEYQVCSEKLFLYFSHFFIVACLSRNFQFHRRDPRTDCFKQSGAIFDFPETLHFLTMVYWKIHKRHERARKSDRLAGAREHNLQGLLCSPKYWFIQRI